MGHRTLALLLGAAAWGPLALAQSAPAQGSGLPQPSPVEKDLAARASNVTEVTLGKNMLAFAAKFMSGKDEDEVATRKLIESLDGIYVREYDFDKDDQYSIDEVDKLRSYFETSEWSPIVRERSRHDGENTDVMVKMVNGETHGMFILEAEPRELTIVLILGPVRLDELGELTHISGLNSLSDVVNDSKFKEKTKEKDTERKLKEGTQ
jgi:hypothetical protein